MTSTPKCGQYVYPTSLPQAANRSISDNSLTKAVSAADVTNAVGGSVTVVYLEDAVIDDAAAIEFADCIGRSLSLTTIILRGCKMSAPSWSAVFAGLVENNTVTEVHFESCALGAEQAKELASNVIPWNRSITSWNLSGNVGIGLAGVSAIFNALSDATSGVQRLSIRRCGVSDSGSAFCSLLLDVVPNLVALYQLDILENEVIGKPDFSIDAIGQVDKALRDNFIANGYDDPETHNSPLGPLIALSIDNMKKKAEATAAAGVAPPSGAKQPTRNSTPVRRGAPSAPAAATQEVKRGQSPARGKSPAPQPATPTRQRPSSTSSPVQRTRSPAAATRSQSANRNSSPARSTASHGPPVQQGVDEGYEEWKRVREEYNKFIRAEGSTKPSQPIHITKYKYAFGKSVDKVKERPSPTFVHSHAGRVREPLPSERRKLAPWNQPGESVNGKKFLFTDEKDPQGARIVVVDGGDVTALNDDPRDMGYLARKKERGELKDQNTGGFASSTPRVCRWGVDGTSGVLRHAQAPGPGTYVVKMEWEVKLEKLRATGRKTTASGKNLFGSSGEERKVFHVKKTDTPGPGEYEIP